MAVITTSSSILKTEQTIAETLNTIRLHFARLCETDNIRNRTTLNTIRLHSARLCESKTPATAPPCPFDRSFTPTTSLLLETAATYSSPVTLYPPLEPLSTVLTSAPRISSKPISTPVLQSLPHYVLLDLTSSTFTPVPLAQPPRNSTSLPPAYSSKFDQYLCRQNVLSYRNVNRLLHELFLL
ncbi:hypothetical protein CHS0354_020472 [Potamilus streckersoni]|uniref:Uncharacterized protein n=1 Tax=Potamilus streckersoni TaxID=2493646 RepID=A0AAE0W5B6_9BIVA|nr:hypothetical protein CHS0354_020472 [Potamilus streckersoni]